ncbi:quinoprotein dehydrogenase-associated SoxYZ-like carrier [Xanthobacteraceae bacterium Astr-EGSB]|uniref:quinoprotein dehydrogenase-associated SoxYZ-like carrier n=1 Tax=Astrobacterium formosum TaxID=3069710 RepID=UPI0027B06833|nr:quinoprotein dehydrogenase-associated SoxYZ-like carrier [Xanthobacteraceae bacterium Astr-EGSB]
MPVLQFRLPAFAFAIATVITAPALAETKDPWPDLARDVFDHRPLADGTGIISIEMPARAEDAALVPVTLRAQLPAGDARAIKSVTLIIDENPAPVAATFTIGGSATTAAIATRVRVNAYTNVHAVAELSDGALYMVETYVKASGGCSAPAAKNAEEARKGMGEMRFRQFASADVAPMSRLREAQIMIRHPNNSGLQMDQVTRAYAPAHFVQTVKVWQGDELVLAMEGGISLSEDPNIRFSYVPNGAKTFRVEARDTEELVFKGEWPVEASAM